MVFSIFSFFFFCHFPLESCALRAGLSLHRPLGFSFFFFTGFIPPSPAWRSAWRGSSIIMRFGLSALREGGTVRTV